ncbi:hypothetical protein KQ876_02205 [Mycoplasma sp. CSL7491-lung]|uniref:DNA polymerase III subunit delta n=1 Tax=Mycoplasma sp. CSL7491-lung TaxID=549718 RepID=UPI001C10489D|nr:hypothetical protein [Mycoplasma sp. CSL7491-lung]MBU4693017.1 hypothetical protein [Mycoplasma sp. CSL7491-lung]
MIFIYGNEEYFINNKINELKDNFLDENIIYFKDNYTISELIESVSSFGLFSTQKLILVENFEIIDSKKITKVQNELSEVLISALKNNRLHKVVFIHRKNSFERNNFVKFLIETAKVFNFEKLDSKSIVNFIVSYITSKGGKISFFDATSLSNKLPNNLSIIINEIDKMLKFNSQINYSLINNNIQNYVLEDSFAFMNAIETNNLNNIYQKYKERFNEGDDIHLLIAQLRNIFSLSYKLHILNNKLKMNYFDISSKLKIPEWRVKKVLKLVNIFGIKKIKNILINLGIVDLQSKSLGVENYEIFETFLITNFTK